MACSTCSTCDNGTCSQSGIFDPSNLLFFFVALCALNGNNCSCANGTFSNLSGSELLLFCLMLALLAKNGNNTSNCSCGNA